MKWRAVIHLLIVVSLFLATFPPGSVAQRSDDPQYGIDLKSRQFSPPPGVEAALQKELADARGGRRHVLLQFNNVPSDAQRAALEAQGVQLLSYVPNYAWFASLPANFNLQAPAMASVRWMGTIQATDRVAPILRERGVQQEMIDDQGQTQLDVRFFPDVSSADALRVLSLHEAAVETKLTDFHRYIVRVDPGAIDALATEDAVQWITAAPPPKTVFNDGTRARTNVNAVQTTPYNLNGANTDLGIWDGGKVSSHVDFSGRLTVVDTGAAVSNHATHVAGTMAGDGSNSVNRGGSSLQWRGMAPGADIISYYWDNNLTDHNSAINTYGIELSQNSWGYAIAEAFPYNNCYLYGDYDGGTPDYDDIITGLYGKRIVVVFAAGNERDDGDCGMSGTPPYLNYANIAPPGTAKNIIAVGATNSNNDSMTTFSSWGPVDDGRLKPDVVAPGCESTGEGYIRSTLPGDTYGGPGWCGTSMAAPAVSGISALIIQQYRTTFGTDPLPSTVKALLIQTAVDLNDGTPYYNPGPDYASGYGRVDAQAAVDAVIAGRVRQDQVSNGQTDTFTINVPGGTPSLKVTLAWDDEPGAVNANPSLVNNLDLVLVEPNGTTTHRPWVLNPANPSGNATTGTDSINNVEQVQVSNPVAGTWEVRITGTNVPVGPQRYSLAGQNFTPGGPANVGPLVYDSHVIDDDNTGNSIGNDDGVANPGETIELFVDLRNSGTNSATDVNATISTSSPYVTFIFNTSSEYGSISAGGTATNLNDFDFQISPSAPHGHVMHFDLNITASNGGPWSAGLDITVVGDGGLKDVALISDQTELQAITPILDEMGLTYDVLNANWNGSQGIYTSNYGFLSNYSVVVWYASGATWGRLITQGEHDALEQFLQAGGRLLVTGYDTLGSPTDPLLADLVRSSSSGDGPFTYDYTITDGNHPITDGPFGSFPTGTALRVSRSDHDQAEADTGRGATTVAELPGGRDKIMATELASGGIVVYWNGNSGALDWSGILTTLQEQGDDTESKRDVEGRLLDGSSQSPYLPHQPEGGFVVGGILSDISPPPVPEPLSDDPQNQSVLAPQGVVVVNFDDASQPCGFISTVALRNEYQTLGAIFDGPTGNDGGAILDECSGFVVSGHSPPNFLAFNASAALSDGGIPRDPEEITFVGSVSSVQVSAGSGLAGDIGQALTMEAFDASDNSLGSDTITLNSALQTLSISASGIARVVISSPASRFVLDDLTFDTELGGGPNGALFKNTLHWLSQGAVVADPHEPNDTPAQCTPIFFDVTITDPTIDPAGDEDYYCFTGSADQTIAADIDAWVNGSPLDSVLTLFDSDGTTILIENDDFSNLDSYLEYTLPSGGTFYLRVRNYSSPDGGPAYTYSILLTDLTAPRSLPFFDDMESGANGWGSDGLWHQVQDGVSPYPNSFSPTHSWWYGQDSTGDYDTGAANSGNLTSPPIEIPLGVQATLSFWQWYETEPQLLPQSVYFDAYHDVGGDDTISGGLFTAWANDLANAGYSVVQYNQPIDLATLRGHQVLALFFPETPLSTEEIGAINAFMQDGGRVVALGEWGDFNGVNTILNALSTPHGITFGSDVVRDSTDNDGQDYWPLIYNYADHPLVRGANTVVLYASSSLSLSGSAVALASGDGDSSTKPITNGTGDGAGELTSGSPQLLAPQDIIPGAPVVMAYAPVGDGGLIAIGDRDLWVSDDPDSDGVIALDEYTNQALSRRLFGREVDHPSWDQKWVQISVDDGPFQNLLQVTGGPMNTWHRMNLDLSPYAGSTVRLRFHFDTFDDAVNYFRGWYIDDVLVEVSDVGPVRYSGHTVDDDNVNESAGNGDGIPDPGETIELFVELANTGADAATNVQACLSEDSPYVSGFLFNTCAAYGDISGGNRAANVDDFDFAINPAAPVGHTIRFDVDITADNGGPWSTSFDIVVGQSATAGPLIYVDAVVDDDNVGQSAGNGDGQINPGEVIELYAEVLNTGNATAAVVAGVISETSPYVGGFFYNIESPYGDIAAGATALNSNDFEFEVDINAPNGHLIPFCLDLTAANGGPWTSCFDIPVVSTASGAALRVEPPDQDVPLSGGDFDVDVMVENVNRLGAFQFDLVYDPSVAHVDSVALGPFLGSSGCSVGEVSPIIDNVAGRLTYGGFIVGVCAGPSGDGVVATITFQPVAAGNSDLTLENEQLLDTDDPPAPITPVSLFSGHVSVTDCFFADTDCDGDVDIADIFGVAFRWGCQCGDACYLPTYDFNDDCSISISDIQIVACYFGWPNGDFSACFTPSASSVLPLPDQSAMLHFVPNEEPPQPGTEGTLLQAATVRVEPTVPIVKNGETFRVDIKIYDALDLGAFQFVIDYDPAVLEVPNPTSPVALGSFLGSTGRAPIELLNEVDPAAGLITYHVATTGPSPRGPDGDGVLAFVNLRARALGTTALDLKNVELTTRTGTKQVPAAGDGQVIVATAPNPAQVSIQKTADPPMIASQGTLTYTVQRGFSLAGAGHKYDEVLYDPIPSGTTYLTGSATLNGLSAPELYSSTLNAISYFGSGVFTDTDQLAITFQVRVDSVPSGGPILNTVVDAVSFDSGPYSGPYTDTASATLICTDVTAVDLALLTSGEIFTNTVVQFSADISPDDAAKPYTYTVDYDDGTTPLTGASSDDPLALSHTFPTTGTHSVEIAVWNCAMTASQAVTDTLGVTVTTPEHWIYLPLLLRNN